MTARVFKEKSKAKGGRYGGPSPNRPGIFIRRGDGDADREETATCKPRREASQKTNPADTWISDF